VQLVAVLREVKYLLIRNMEEIPVSASQLYANNDTLLMYVAHLDLTVAWYNKIRETVLEVEYPIIERQLQAIDEQLLQAEQTLDWQSDGKLTATVVNGAGTTGHGGGQVLPSTFASGCARGAWHRWANEKLAKMYCHHESAQQND